MAAYVINEWEAQAKGGLLVPELAFLQEVGGEKALGYKFKLYTEQIHLHLVGECVET